MCVEQAARVVHADATSNIQYRSQCEENGSNTHRVSSARSVWFLTRRWIIGSAKTRPATSSTQVEMNMLMNLQSSSAVIIGHLGSRETQYSRRLLGVGGPRPSASCALYRFIEAGKVGKLRGVVRHRADDPVRRRLPHRIEQAAEDVQEDAARVPVGEDVILVRRVRREGLACVFSGISANVDVSPAI